MTNSFTYDSQPHSAPLSHADRPRLSLMADPRVIRGNTHAIARKISKFLEGENVEAKITSIKQSSSRGFRKIDSSGLSRTQAAPFYSFECKPFAEDIDLSQYLIEGEATAAANATKETQIDSFQTETQPTKYIPIKTGVDIATQVENTNDLFDFDLEVIPILEVICSKTLEQSLMEVTTEYEISRLQNEILDFEETKKKEELWMVEQEALLRSQIQEKELLLESVLRESKKRKLLKSTVAGVQLMRQINQSLLDTVSKELLSAGEWIDVDRFDVENSIASALQTASTMSNDYLHCEEVITEALSEAVNLFEEQMSPSSVGPSSIACMISIRPTLQTEDQEEEVDTKASTEVRESVEVKVLEFDTISSFVQRLKTEGVLEASKLSTSQIEELFLLKFNDHNAEAHRRLFNVSPIPLTSDCRIPAILFQTSSSEKLQLEV